MLRKQVRRRSSSSRIAPLAVLPVFFKLEDRPVLVAGGSEAAAWKAELLAAAGAHVLVHAEHLSAQMLHLLHNGPAAGSLLHVARSWTQADMTGKALALIDAETDEEAQAFTTAARAAGIPANVIDNPAFCDFQFGSIVNRSPAVIAISTDGAAPVLGQAIRRRIEAVLPAGLAFWAAQAARIRPKVMARLAPGQVRRAFWERFTDLAFADVPSSRNPAVVENVFADIGPSSSNPDATGRGSLTIVGAGPGKAEHLTLKAVRALQSADVILHDPEISSEILELARREARRIAAPAPQRQDHARVCQLSALILDATSTGRAVVRLVKGSAGQSSACVLERKELDRLGYQPEIVPGLAINAETRDETAGLARTG